MAELAAAVETVRNAHVLGKRFALLVSGIVAFLAAVIAFTTTRSITKPLVALHKGTEIIGSGKLDYQVATNAKDEIVQLSRAFDQMTGNLKKTTASRDELDAANQQLRASQQQLRAANQQLDASNQQLRAKEQQMLSLNHNLNERVKELDCLYGISEIVESSADSLEDILRGVVEIIPPSWQYPEITCAKISLGDQEYKAKNFKETDWRQSCDIFVNGQRVGAVDICYLEEKPCIDEGPFLSEERKLLNSVGERLGHIIERIEMHNKLQETNQQLQAGQQQLRAANQQLDASNQQLRASEQQLKAANQQLDASNQQLRATEQQLKAGNQQLRANEQQLRAFNLHLTERAKELDCLYRVSELIMQVDKSMDDIFTRAVNYIPPAWQYPEITCAKISIKGHEYITDNFRESEWKMTSDITTSQEKIGFIEVCYLEEKPVIYEGPFLKEERNLIDTLCRQAASIYKRKQAEQSLEISNRDLTDFVHIASHDLREPSRKISSFGQLLAESVKNKLNEEEQENLDFMIDGAKRMQEMVDSLLVYSRVTTKDVTLDEIDLNEMVEQLKELELANSLEEAKGSVLIPEMLPSIKGDHSQIRQLLQNLISNALKYHRENVLPEVTVRAFNQSGMVRIEVADNGIGIEEKHYNNIFVMFRRLHSRQEYSGTGIGLAVCKKIVERHNGKIGVSSIYGQGSTFWFTVPAVKIVSREQEQLVSSLTS